MDKAVTPGDDPWDPWHFPEANIVKEVRNPKSAWKRRDEAVANVAMANVSLAALIW
ncbi:hypothetical protein [Bradyrhizobium sp. BR 10289]|uniref:hypothetical protein n=1 Tax=Bradyrhizobium sp. BR 10289 TaxID=2749993 RepID=UPI001C64B1BF|nr:hypothetical protein [Bradyrhizobium sp. BR 10289]MBW7970124.1 hypothetical protein [Bradyrhizobium sp. BR 10289]